MKIRQTHLVLPGTLFMTVTMGIVIIYTLMVSFWSMKGFVLVPDWSLKNYIQIFTNWSFAKTIFFTIKETFLVLALVLIVSYPVAYFLVRVVKSERVKLILLMLCIIPFWTSYIIRMMTWMPMLGKNGVINSILIGIGLIDKPSTWILFSEPAVVFVMVFLYSVFCVGPIFFVMSQVEEEVIESAQDLGASGFKTFWYVLVPLSLPGVATGALFIIVMTLGEYATNAIIGGNKYPMIGNNIMVRNLAAQWAPASAYSIILMLITMVCVVILFRVINIRKRLR